MKIEFVGHASLFLDMGEVQMVMDPWLEGTVFNNGWELLSPASFGFEDFGRITHIWFSHEHPDHFFPPNIKQIPEEHRRNITVLYQETNDKKVVEFCKKLGFKQVIELGNSQPLHLTGDITLKCGTIGHDSWLLITTDGKKLLNTNDCILNTEAAVSNLLAKTGTVDILATQFSYASWAGIDAAARKKSAAAKLKQFALQIEKLKPKFILPFASYVRFCHEENGYLNDSVNTIADINEFLAGKPVQPLIMYPGMEWEVSSNWDSTQALELYKQDYIKAAEKPLVPSKPYTSTQLEEDVSGFIQRAHKKLPWIYKRYLNKTILNYPFIVYVSDLKQAYRLGNKGLEKVNLEESKTSMSITAESLSFCFRFDWGFDTTFINGRFTLHSEKGLQPFYRLISIGNVMNHSDGSLQIILRAIKKRLAF